MNNDLALQENVAAELALDPRVDASSVAVAARDGVVTLSGSVPTFAEKIAAERAVKRVTGVRGLALDVTVEPPLVHRRTDADIAIAALNALERESTFPADAVTVKVESGWLTLDGRLEWDYQKRNAERAVRNLAGVVGMTDRIVVASPEISDTDVAGEIRRAFERRADIDAARIVAEARDKGTVRLCGSVDSWTEHDDAAQAAFAVPGVSSVINDLVVASS